MRRHYDAIVIDAGVRLEPALTELFEALVYTVRANSAQSVMCFNTGPDSTAAAVERWWSSVRPCGSAARPIPGGPIESENFQAQVDGGDQRG